MDGYRNAVKRRKGKSGDAATKIRKWSYEDQMSFLQSVQSQPDSTGSNITTEEPETLTDEDEPSARYYIISFQWISVRKNDLITWFTLQTK